MEVSSKSIVLHENYNESDDSDMTRTVSECPDLNYMFTSACHSHF